MGQLDKLESVLDENLNKKAPVKIPPEGRKTLAVNMWWIALIFGVLQLWVAWDLWRVGHVVNEFVDYANTIARAYGGGDTVDGLGAFYYFSLIVLFVDAVILLLAAPGLKAMRRAGWNLLFYGMLLNVGYGLVRMFSGHGGGVDDLLWAIVTSLIGAYLLFQVRDYFTGAGVPAKAADHKPAAEHKTEHHHKTEDKK